MQDGNRLPPRPDVLQMASHDVEMIVALRQFTPSLLNPVCYILERGYASLGQGVCTQMLVLFAGQAERTHNQSVSQSHFLPLRHDWRVKRKCTYKENVKSFNESVVVASSNCKTVVGLTPNRGDKLFKCLRSGNKRIRDFELRYLTHNLTQYLESWTESEKWSVLNLFIVQNVGVQRLVRMYVCTQ